MEKIEFTARDGRTYVIALSDDGEEISVQLDGVRLGQISLRFVEGPDNEIDYYHITHLELDRCKGCGIGTRCLQFHVEGYGCTLTAGRNDGFSRRWKSPNGRWTGLHRKDARERHRFRRA